MALTEEYHCHNRETRPAGGTSCGTVTCVLLLEGGLRATRIPPTNRVRCGGPGSRHVERGVGARAGSAVGRRRFGAPRPRAILEPPRVRDVATAFDAMNGLHFVAPI